MVTRTDNATDEKENSIQVDQARSNSCTDNAHVAEHDGHQHGRKKFEESFNPKMDDPETPVVDDSKVAVRAVKKCGNIEKRDRHSRVEKERCQVRGTLFLNRRAKSPEHEKDPKGQGSCKKNLPESAQIKILGTLVAQPEPQRAEFVIDAEILATQAAEHHHKKCNKEQIHTEFLSLRLMSSDPGGEEQPARNPRCGYPEYDQLKMIGPQKIIREQIEYKVEAVETRRFHSVMGQPTAGQCLQQEKEGDNKEILACPPLAG